MSDPQNLITTPPPCPVSKNVEARSYSASSPEVNESLICFFKEHVEEVIRYSFQQQNSLSRPNTKARLSNIFVICHQATLDLW